MFSPSLIGPPLASVPPSAHPRSSSDPPGIEEDELHVQTSAEHEGVAVHLDLGDGRGGQRVTDRHQAVDLVTAAIWSAVETHQLDLGVAAAVDGLGQVGAVTSAQKDQLSREVNWRQVVKNAIKIYCGRSASWHGEDGARLGQ